MGSKATVKKNTTVGKRLKKRRSVQCISAHAAFIHAEGFAHNQNHIGAGSQTTCPWPNFTAVRKIFIFQTHEVFHQGVKITGLFFTINGSAELESSKKILERIEGKVGFEAV